MFLIAQRRRVQNRLEAVLSRCYCCLGYLLKLRRLLEALTDLERLAKKVAD
jgi:hypothetical protein